MTSGGPNPALLSTEFQPRRDNRSAQGASHSSVSEADPKVWGLGFCAVRQNAAPGFRASRGHAGLVDLLLKEARGQKYQQCEARKGEKPFQQQMAHSSALAPGCKRDDQK